jgi:hypothetical protein
MQVAVPVSALGANYSSFCQALVSIFSPFYARFVRKTGALEVTEHLVTQLGALNKNGHFTVFFHRVDVKVPVFGKGTPSFCVAVLSLTGAGAQNPCLVKQQLILSCITMGSGVGEMLKFKVLL